MWYKLAITINEIINTYGKRLDKLPDVTFVHSKYIEKVPLSEVLKYCAEQKMQIGIVFEAGVWYITENKAIQTKNIAPKIEELLKSAA